MNQKINFNQGQAMIITVILFLAFCLIAVYGIIGPVFRHTLSVKSINETKKSLFLAEAGIEDAVYRLKNGLNVAPVNTIILDGESAETVVSDLGGGKEIRTDSDFEGYLRSVKVRLETGSDASFHYGIQSGTGGVRLRNNSTVDGNVYSNGNVEGSNGAVITGSAYSANTPAISANQTNESPIPSPNSVIFGRFTATQDFAQSFQLNQSGPINKIALHVRKNGTPSSVTVRIVPNAAGNKPGTTSLAQGTMSASLVTSSFGWVEVAMSSNPVLDLSQTYWIVIDSSSNSNHYYEISANTSYAAGTAKSGQYGGTSWNDTSPAGLDGYFKVFLGGLTGMVSDVTVGTDGGDAHAHTVNNVNVSGNLYCQVGSGNNKSCNTSLPDPAPQTFPVSDANIAAWKEAAEAGGIVVGNVNLEASTSSLGPKKIVGNLYIENGHVLTLTGTVWVTGDIIITNNSVVRLASGYESNSGMIVTDGTVTVNNNSTFTNSGTSGSYIMVLSTYDSNCPVSGACLGSYAINVGNNTGAVVLYAQNGGILFSNNAAAKSAVADRLEMDNNAFITYDSGLVNVNFVSGPTGGFDILSWREVE